MEDATNRDTRQNLRLIGLREKLENGKPLECVRKIIYETQDGAGRRATAASAPVAMPDEDRPPRPIY